MHGGHVSRVTLLGPLPFSDPSPVAVSRHFSCKKKQEAFKATKTRGILHITVLASFQGRAASEAGGTSVEK